MLELPWRNRLLAMAFCDSFREDELYLTDEFMNAVAAELSLPQASSMPATRVAQSTRGALLSFYAERCVQAMYCNIERCVPALRLCDRAF